MNLNVFVPLNMDKISKLSFIERTVPLLFQEFVKGPLLSGVIHEISNETTGKLKKLLTGKDYQIKKGDKVYVFPNCKIPQFKIKEILRQLEAKFTSNYNEATGYLGTEQAFADPILRQEFSLNLLGSTYLNTFNIGQKKHLCNETKDTLNNIANYRNIYDNISFVYIMDGDQSTHYFNVTTSVPSLNFLMPLGAEIVYNILSKKLPVISENNFLRQSTPTCIIDKEMYQSLNDMLQSTDETNNFTALQTIANSDVKGSWVYIWLLVKSHYILFRQSRFKNIKLFNEMINLKEVYNESVRDFIVKLINNNPNNINHGIVKQLLDSEAETFVENMTSDIFDIVLIPKLQFKAVLPELTYKYELDND